MNVEDVSLINLGLVKPNLSEEEQSQFDFYHPMSLIGSGWSTLTKMFHMEAKTWFYCIEINVKEDGFKIGYANCNGEYININKTYNSGDIIRLYMVSSLEFGEENGVNNATVNMYYVLPFLSWYREDLGLPYIKGVVDDIKKQYLIQEHRTDNLQHMFDFGKPKLVKSTFNLTGNSNSIGMLNNDLNGTVLNYTKARDKFNKDTEDVYYLVNTRLPKYIEDINNFID